MSHENELAPGEREGLWATVQSGAQLVDRRRRQRRGVFTGAIAVVIVAGVLGGVTALTVSNRDQMMAPSPSPTAATVLPSPTRTATPAPTTSPTSSPSLTSSPPPAAPPESPIGDDPSQWIVTDTGMGPLKLGMPFDEALAAVPGASIACPHAGSAFELELWMVGWPEVFDGPGGPLSLISWGNGRNEALDYGPQTAEGIGIGSTEADVRTTYPGVEEIFRQTLNLRTGNIFFSIDGGVVAEIGVTDADVPYEYCG